MGEGEKQGLAAVLAEAVAPPAAAPEQLSLLSAEEAGPAEAEPGASPLDVALAAMGEGFMRPRRGAGRPAGSRNRRTEDWQRLVLATHRSPLLVLADVYSMPVEELALRLSCTKLDALKLQIAAAKELAPYLHQRLPQAVNLDVSGNLPTLILNMGGGAALTGAPEAGETLELVAVDLLADQGLRGAAAKHSDSSVSDSAVQAVETPVESGSHPTDLGSVQ